MSDFEFEATSREELLAEELAERLGDPDGLPYYLTVVHSYPEAEIRKVLGMVLEVPEDRIRISRGALFNWYISHNARLRKPRKDGDAI